MTNEQIGYLIIGIVALLAIIEIVYLVRKIDGDEQVDNAFWWWH